MSTLTEFLLARIAEDERELFYEFSAGEVAQIGGRPVDMRARVLAECEAKRRIVEMHTAFSEPQHMVYGTITACCECGSVDDAPVEWPCPTLRALAQPHADHPDYRDEWKP